MAPSPPVFSTALVAHLFRFVFGGHSAANVQALEALASFILIRSLAKSAQSHLGRTSLSAYHLSRPFLLRFLAALISFFSNPEI